MNLLREFDLEYWQMREALGYPIPNRIAARWPKQMMGPPGNPHRCGMCEARKRFPETHARIQAERAGGFFVPADSAETRQ